MSDDNPFSGDNYYDKNLTGSGGIEDSEKDPSEKPVMYKKVKGFRFGYNHIQGVLNSTFRWGQFVKHKLGMHPEEGQIISVIFEIEDGEADRETVDYEVRKIRNRQDLHSNPDKYKFKCGIVDESLIDEGYPRSVYIGSRTGEFYVREDYVGNE